MPLNELCEKCKSLFNADWSDVPRKFWGRPFQWRLEAKDEGEDTLDQTISATELDAEAIKLQPDAERAPGWADDSRELDAIVKRSTTKPVFHHNLDTLRRNADSGACHFCTALWTTWRKELDSYSGVEHFGAGDGSRQASSDLLALVTLLPMVFYWEEDSPSIWFWAYQRSMLARPLDQHFIYDLLPPALTVQVTGEKPSGRLRQESRANILAWMRTCLDSHDDCKKPSALPHQAYPPRLLYIYPSNDNHDPGVKLVTTEDLTEKPPYATLSHRWGGKSAGLLIRSSFEALQQGKTSSALPPTFQEAVCVCHELGIQYLWIDTLCIVQDDDGDWQHHVGIMADVYNNSLINLAAAYSESSQGGLLGQMQNPLAFNPVITDIQWQGDADVNGTYCLYDRGAWSYFVEKAPLHYRGWVLQETLLSPRTINFSSDQIRWRCKASFGSETMPALTIDDPVCVRDVLAHFRAGGWYYLISDYKILKLTKSTDVLAALAGIATVYGQLCNYRPEDYIAGLWKPRLTQQLLWGAYNGRHRTDGVVPSWTWASVIDEPRRKGMTYAESVTQVSPEDVLLNHKFSISETCANISGASPFVDAHGAYLKVQGILHMVSLNTAAALENYPSIFVHDELGIGKARHLRFPQPTSKVKPSSKLLTTSPNDMADSSRWRYFDARVDRKKTDIEPITSILFMPILQELRSSRFEFDIKQPVIGLLLEATSDKGTYRRLGTLRLGRGERREGDSNQDDLADLPEWHAGADLEPSQYLRSLGGGCYEIKLV